MHVVKHSTGSSSSLIRELSTASLLLESALVSSSLLDGCIHGAGDITARDVLCSKVLQHVLFREAASESCNLQRVVQ